MNKKKPHQFKVGDRFRFQGFEITVVATVMYDGAPVYEIRSPFTNGEPWLMSERYLVQMEQMRMRRRA